MLSSSISMFVNKRSTVSASQFSRFARGGIRERPLSACPHARWLKGLSYCLTTKVNGVDYLPSK